MVSKSCLKVFFLKLCLIEGVLFERYLIEGKLVQLGFNYLKGVLSFERRLVIYATLSRVPKLQKKIHSTPQHGHSRFHRTFRHMALNVYWIDMNKSLQKFVQKCNIIQLQKYIVAAPRGLLQSLLLLEKFWEDLPMDFITRLPKSNGFEVIFMVVDRVSK